MKSQKSNKDTFNRITLVISDLHLGAGSFVDGKRNHLEDFHMDSELIEFLDYHSSGQYLEKDVELIINGDFLDLLAVPYIKYFDDEFWSEEAALEKLKMIVEAHRDVFAAMKRFLTKKQKKIVYIIGNHDAELVFDSLQDYLKKLFPVKTRNKFELRFIEETYNPVPGVYIHHGHEYELAHHFTPKENIITSANGGKYFLPPWGSYFVTHVINKYKPERTYVNEVKPAKAFLIHGLIYDTLFTLRFFFASAYYFFMVRFLHFFFHRRSWSEVFHQLKKELEIWKDYSTLTRDFFEEEKEARALIVGHTHQAAFRSFPDGTTFINTGTWVRIINLDFKNLKQGHFLTFAKVYSSKKKFDIKDFDDNVFIELNEWKGSRDRPYDEFV